jgi:hypothetical protein
MGCFFSREKDAKAPTHVVVEPQRPELGLWLSFFFLGRRGAFFLCVVVLSASFCVFGLFFFSPPSVHCGPGAVRMCNAEEINRSFLMRKEGYSLFFLLLMIAETTVVYSIRFFFPCPFFCFLSLRKE